MEYELTPHSQEFITREIVKEITVFSVVLVLTVIFFPQWYETLRFSLFAIGGFVAYYVFLFLAPCLLLKKQYVRHNAGLKLQVEASRRELILMRNDEERDIPINNIVSVVLSLGSGPYWGRRRSSWYTTDIFQYAVVKLEDGTNIVITNLLVADLKKFFDDLGIADKVKKEWRYIPWINMKRYEKPKQDPSVEGAK